MEAKKEREREDWLCLGERERVGYTKLSCVWSMVREAEGETKGGLCNSSPLRWVIYFSLRIVRAHTRVCCVQAAVLLPPFPPPPFFSPFYCFPLSAF